MIRCAARGRGKEAHVVLVDVVTEAAAPGRGRIVTPWCCSALETVVGEMPY